MGLFNIDTFLSLDHFYIIPMEVGGVNGGTVTAIISCYCGLFKHALALNGAFYCSIAPVLCE